MMQRFLRLPILIFALTTVAGVSAPSHTFAQERDVARAAFRSGVAQYAAGDYTTALTSFQEAYRIAPHPSVRVNMANCYEQLGRPIEAIEHFERFLVESADATAEQQQEIRAAIRRLEQQVAEVFLRITPDGSTITIDDVTTLRSPQLDAIILTAGTHTIRITRPGFAPFEQRLELVGGSREELTVTLEQSSDPQELDVPDDGAGTVNIDPAEPEDESGGLQLTTPVLIAGSATVVFAVVSIVTGVMALGAESDFDQAVIDTRDPSMNPAEARQRGLDAESSANTLALVSDIFLVGAIAGAATTVVLFLMSGEDDDDAMAFQVAPRIGVHEAGVQLRGSF